MMTRVAGVHMTRGIICVTEHSYAMRILVYYTTTVCNKNVYILCSKKGIGINHWCKWTCWAVRIHYCRNVGIQYYEENVWFLSVVPVQWGNPRELVSPDVRENEDREEYAELLPPRAPHTLAALLLRPFLPSFLLTSYCWLSYATSAGVFLDLEWTGNHVKQVANIIIIIMLVVLQDTFSDYLRCQSTWCLLVSTSALDIYMQLSDLLLFSLLNINAASSFNQPASV